MIGRVLIAIACALGVAGCTKEEQHPAYASGTCLAPPCGGGIYSAGAGAGSPDGGADAADARD